MSGCTSTINELPGPTISNAPAALPPSVMVNNTLYFYTGRIIFFDTAEYECLGTITSVVTLSQMPSENGQSNMFNIVDAPYVVYEDGLALFWDDEWHFFETREDD
ncbi:MAG: hypothetical protein FWG43_05495 [Clostridiales bacterium]|nr:hypothetical protein [Clostridiales bacterium]